MFFALDEHKNRIHAGSIDSQSHYFCPVCGNPVKHRKGSIRRPHFAHLSESNCPYGRDKDYDHEWHIRMQEYFPLENREHIFKDSETGERHIADIFIPESNIVLEFQHSPISEKEFQSRTNFYIKSGYKLVWAFDESVSNLEKYPNGKFLPYVLSPLSSNEQVIAEIGSPFQYEIDRDNPYKSRCFQWLINKRKILLENFLPLWRLQTRLSICVFTGLDGDCFHRLQFQRFEDTQTVVTFSLHDIFMKEGMNVEEFFQPETEYWNNTPFLESYYRFINSRTPLQSNNQIGVIVVPNTRAWSQQRDFEQRKEIVRINKKHRNRGGGHL